MFRRYGHGHSAGLGFLLALALMQHALLFGVLVFGAGLVAGRAWATLAAYGQAGLRRLKARGARA